jgi:transposase
VAFRALWPFSLSTKVAKKKTQQRGRWVHEVSEHYTSKCCGKCGILDCNLGGKKIYNCTSKKCDFVLDRDFNGARNILIMNLHHHIGGAIYEGREGFSSSSSMNY